MVDALALHGIRKSFDGFLALDGADFTARWNEVHALLGENGAGKSSLMNIAAGLYAPEAGSILINDNPVRLNGPSDAAKHHIGMVHQHFKLVRPFTVAQNIWLGQASLSQAASSPHGSPRGRQFGSHDRRMAELAERVRAQAAELGFSLDPTARVDTLSIAEQQRVEILKVLMAGARILILDEPTAVLTDREAERLLQTVQTLAERGAAVVLVTHKMADVKTYADRVTVMRGGRHVATCDPRQTEVAELIRLTVGDGLPLAPAGATLATSATASTALSVPTLEPISAATSSTSSTVHLDAGPAARSHPLPAAPANASSGVARLTVRGLTSPGAADARRTLNGVDLRVHAGEIYGLAGIGGNGQGELANAIAGLEALGAGSIELAGFGDLRAATPQQRRALQIGLIPADRQGQALAGSLSITENFGIGRVHTGRFGPAGWLQRGRMRAEAREAVQAFDVQGVRSIDQKAALLSGGNAQKLVIAREFSKSPQLLVVHSPSRGLDVRATSEVHARLRAARDSGAAVLLISEDLEEVLSLADRIGVMTRGRIVAEFAQPADRQAIGQAMVDHA